jgi:hypothetical protein
MAQVRYYFQFDPYQHERPNDLICFFVSTVELIQAVGRGIPDHHLADELNFPPGYGEVMESTFEVEGLTQDEIRAYLLSRGDFEERDLGI